VLPRGSDTLALNVACIGLAMCCFVKKHVSAEVSCGLDKKRSKESY